MAALYPRTSLPASLSSLTPAARRQPVCCPARMPGSPGINVAAFPPGPALPPFCGLSAVPVAPACTRTVAGVFPVHFV